jgi:hypothetical protein
MSYNYKTYTVTVKPQVGYEVKSETVEKLNHAIALAKTWAKENDDPENGVYISFFQRNNGQKGYINPDGSADLVGKSWT